MPGPWPNTGLSRIMSMPGLPHVVAVAAAGVGDGEAVHHRRRAQDEHGDHRRRPAPQEPRRAQHRHHGQAHQRAQPRVARARDERAAQRRERQRPARRAACPWRAPGQGPRESASPRAAAARAATNSRSRLDREEVGGLERGQHDERRTDERRQHAQVAAPGRRSGPRRGTRGARAASTRTAIEQAGRGHVVAEEAARAGCRGCRSRGSSTASSAPAARTRPPSRAASRTRSRSRSRRERVHGQVEEREQHELLRALVRGRAGSAENDGREQRPDAEGEDGAVEGTSAPAACVRGRAAPTKTSDAPAPGRPGAAKIETGQVAARAAMQAELRALEAQRGRRLRPRRWPPRAA